jgi:hypothetical protein
MDISILNFKIFKNIWSEKIFFNAKNYYLKLKKFEFETWYLNMEIAISIVSNMIEIWNLNMKFSIQIQKTYLI